ncbi:MAG: hypothetical protein U0X39_03170 [Bacteroidales bacterium]
MNKKYLLSLFVLTISFNLVQAQFSKFDLSGYKLPEIKTNRLDFNINLNNSGNYRIQGYPNDTLRIKQNLFSLSGGLSFYRFINNERHQGTTSIHSDFNTANRFEESGNLESTLKSIDAYFAIDADHYFFNSSQYFIGAEPSFRINAGNDRSRTDYNSNSGIDYSSSTSLSLSIPLSVGHGRIEPVEDLRLAIYIVEELNKAGGLLEMPSEEIILGMAREISKIKRKRFLDSRLRKIEELQVIDSFLVANNVVKGGDIRYFTILNDQWDYASGPARESGFSWNGGLDNSVSLGKGYARYGDMNDPYRSDSKYSEVFAGVFFKLRYAKPLNLYWQVSAQLRSAYGILVTRYPGSEDSDITDYNSGRFNTEFRMSLQYLPNSRTSFNLGLSGYSQNINSDRVRAGLEPAPYHLVSNIINVSPYFDFYYYISPRLRIQLDSQLSSFVNRSSMDFDSQVADIDECLRVGDNQVILRLVYSFF